MIEPLSETRSDAAALSPPAASPLEAPTARRLARIQFGLCLTLTTALLVYLLWTPGTKSSGGEGPAAPEQSPVRLTPSGHIQIQAGSPLHRKLQSSTVKPKPIAAPILTVTGTVVASLRPVKGKGRFWQFNSPELLTTYTDWQKAIAEINFSRRQLDSIKQLAESRVHAQAALVERLRKLVAAGTDTEKDLAAARTEALQAQIQARKDTHEAETACRLAQRAEAALSRQLQQAGVDPELLRVTDAELDVVVADVPEALVSRVKLGQGCQARFFGVASKVFSGNLRAISPVLSRERRSLRVLFAIDDPDDLLRPGMFADIGLGTDSRDALLIPASGVVHVGRDDYALVRKDADSWRVAAVQVGELHQQLVEILSGLRAGEQVLTDGAILLKPFIMEAVQGSASRGSGGS